MIECRVKTEVGASLSIGSKPGAINSKLGELNTKALKIEKSVLLGGMAPLLLLDLLNLVESADFNIADLGAEQ